MTHIRIHKSIRELSPRRWDDCFPGEIENYNYLLAIESSGIEGFLMRYVVAETGERLLAAMPAFFVLYNLGTTLVGAPKRIVDALRVRMPSFLTIRLACFGSPETEHVLLGFHSLVAVSERPSILARMVGAFERLAEAEGARLLGAKDIRDQDLAMWKQVWRPRGYSFVASLPGSWLPIRFATVDEYLSSLSPGTRRDMRRKLKLSSAVRVEQRSSIEDVLVDVEQMYVETRGRSDWQFEKLSANYFRDVLQCSGENAVCFLYYVEDTKLAGINLLLVNGDQLLDKFFCMHSSEGKAHNLYFLSWFRNIDYCLKNGIRAYQGGQAGYETKLKLGCKLTRNWIAFRHRNSFINAIMKMLIPLLAIRQPEAERQ